MGVVTDEMRWQWQSEAEERASTLKLAKAAAVEAVCGGVAVPEWAAEQIKNSIEEEHWWSDPVGEGFWIGEHEIPEPIDSIDTYYFDGYLTEARQEALLAGAPPTEEERIVHRNCFLDDLFTNPQNWENELTFWQIFEMRESGKSCLLLVASTSLGQGGNSIDVFEFFSEAEAALDRLRLDGVLDVDFRRWRKG